MHILHRGGREIGAIYIYRRHPHGKHGDNDKLALFPRLRSENNCVSPWQHNFWLGHQLMAFHKNRRQKRIWFDMYREKNVQVATSQAFMALALKGGRDNAWYPDIGATTHITSNDDSMDDKVDYQGGGLLVGNGTKAPIQHIDGSSSSQGEV
ncbi:uncharacterized protein LOC116251060 isoform X2 [Nymphaea colorata]|uniref:uncharacterized protein LOC116251060 isoform X2 n=1 Tax=Nymphaea colorata TaxID=210225 RepID=UPI00129DDC36|nr:uncharacterized protein LOC116251060 isoform X2 [Nymphaea colorata]